MKTLRAYAPVATPVLSAPCAVRSISDSRAARSTYASTTSRRSGAVIFATSGCSGASTTNVAPNTVSGRVVKKRISAPSWPSTGNAISAPSDRPIQFVCITRTRSGQSMPSKLSSSSAYLVIRKNHCSRARFSTGVSHRSHLPPMTCSLASTVRSFGHQFTGAFAR